ncbi:hypothetical protein LCGC14_2158970, partial [marine sediment metagenome]
MARHGRIVSDASGSYLTERIIPVKKLKVDIAALTQMHVTP